MDSFVYIWTNILTNQKYIGVHKGTPDDGYVCSSKIMLEDYKNNPDIFEREILAYGSFDEMYDLESRLLCEVDAAKNPQFYNRSNNTGKFYIKKHTSKTKIKISKKHKGRVAHNKGVPNPAQRERMLQDNPMKNPKIAAKVAAKLVGKPSPFKTQKTFNWTCSWCKTEHTSLDNSDNRSKKQDKVFCNKSCAASYSNTHRYANSHPPAAEQLSI
jgi:hypothetical protein